MNKKEKILEVKNLSFSYGKKKILDSINFSIGKAEIVSLIGLNGTGKSTLLKNIVGILKPSKGAEIIKRGKIFYIPQSKDLNTSFPISVKEFCELYGGKDFEEILERLNISKLLDCSMRDLSGGEYQKVLIAIALSQKPDLLLLDEITAGIDVVGEESFYKLVLDIREKYQVAVLVVSHNIHLVIRNADQVLCLAGHLCCTGKPHMIKDNEVFVENFGQYLQPYIHQHDHTH